ncbi:MAG: SGNH/GDSL hydrolase family protein [Ruminococcaceae bacterium]|nr:SGNH/GDSL hydrolase family protein [Oscillospiraceae bacterium]
MELKGKKMVVLGDSITEGRGTSCPEALYHALVGKWGECREVVNHGISGTRFAKQIHPEPEGSTHDLDFCLRVNELDEDADIVIVFGGTNDYGHGDAPIGQFFSRDPYTFYGAAHYIMTRLHQRFPGKTVVIMTPLHRVNEFAPDSNGESLRTYVNIIREVAEYYAIPVLDLYATSGIQPALDCNREMFCPDGLHPNDAGHVLLAERLYAFLKAL